MTSDPGDFQKSSWHGSSGIWDQTAPKPSLKKTNPEDPECQSCRMWLFGCRRWCFFRLQTQWGEEVLCPWWRVFGLEGRCGRGLRWERFSELQRVEMKAGLSLGPSYFLLGSGLHHVLGVFLCRFSTDGAHVCRKWSSKGAGENMLFKGNGICDVDSKYAGCAVGLGV